MDGPRGQDLSVIVFAPAAREIFAFGRTGIRPTTSGDRLDSVDERRDDEVRGALNRLGTLPPR